MAVLEKIESRTISGFILPNQESLALLNKITESIQRERTSWGSSGAAEKLVIQWTEIYEKNPLLNKNILPQEEAIKNKKASLYADQASIKGDSDRFFSLILAQLPHGLRADVNNLTDIELEHMTNYRGAIKPLVQEKDEIADRLVVTWQDFMADSPGNFQDFALFIDSEQYQEEREGIRPFLQALEGYRSGQLSRGKDALDSLKRQAIESSLANPRREELGALITEVQGKPEWSKSRINPSMLSWMQLLSEDIQINEDLVADKILSRGIFPADLEAYFKSYLEYGLNFDALAIKRSLSEFKPEKIRSVSLDLSLISKKGRKRGSKIQPINIHEDENSLAEETKPNVVYLSAFDDGENTPEQYVQDKVRAARTDAALREDLVGIVKQVEQDPYGLGAGKLKGDSFYVIDGKGRRIYQMHFRPNKIQGMDFQTSEAERYRAVYHIEPLENLERLVVIDDLLHHNEFDKKYTF